MTNVEKKILKNVQTNVDRNLLKNSRRLLGAYCEFMLLSSILTLWIFSRSFAISLKIKLRLPKHKGINKVLPVALADMRSGETWDINYGHYRTIKRLANLINHLIGANLGSFLAEFILYYSTNFNAVFVDQHDHLDWIKITHLGFYFCSACSVLYFAADTCFQVHSDRSILFCRFQKTYNFGHSVT